MELARRLGELVDGLAREHARVVVGVDCSAADVGRELADALGRSVHGHVLRASLDSFVPRAGDHEPGTASPRDSDAVRYKRFRRELLTPFARGGAAAVLVVDGTRLLRPELYDAWTLSVHLDVAALGRSRADDGPGAAAAPDVLVRYDASAAPLVVRWPG